MIEMQGKWKPLRSAVDMHIHIGPDAVERYYDSIDLAQDAAELGMKAVVIKDQLCPTYFKAKLSEKFIRKEYPDFRVFGSIVLNEPCGGLSPRSVAYALKCGAKVVWLPTVDAAYCYQKGMSGHWIKRVNDRNTFRNQNPQYTIIDADGNATETIKDIMQLIRAADAVLATGHVSPAECIALLKANQSIGCKVVVTHPNLWFDDYTVELLEQMVALGAYLEMTSGGLTPNRGHGDIYEMVDVIKKIGPEHCTLATDAGAADCCAPPENLRGFCYMLRNCGLTEEEIELMAQKNPSKLLGI